MLDKGPVSHFRSYSSQAGKRAIAVLFGDIPYAYVPFMSRKIIGRKNYKPIQTDTNQKSPFFSSTSLVLKSS